MSMYHKHIVDKFYLKQGLKFKTLLYMRKGQGMQLLLIGVWFGLVSPLLIKKLRNVPTSVSHGARGARVGPAAHGQNPL